MKLHKMPTPLVNRRPWYLLPPVNAAPALLDGAHSIRATMLETGVVSNFHSSVSVVPSGLA